MSKKSSADPALDRWGRDVRGVAGEAIIRSAYRSWFRVEWDGLEHIPETGGALLVANHAGMMPVDGGIIWHGIEQEAGRHVNMLAHHGFFRFPFIGQILNRIGAVVANPDNAHRLLREDQGLVLVFPEGEKGPIKSRSERYRLQRFGRGGFVETAMRAGVPIIPIVLLGTEDATPTIATIKLGRSTVPLTLNSVLFGPIVGTVAPFPVKIRVRVLPPVYFEEASELTSYSRSVSMDRSEAIRSDMQKALDDLHASRHSIWFG